MKRSILNFIKRYDIYLLAVLLYLPLTFLGYGSDSDTYGVLWTGIRFAKTFDYVPSRPPGFLVFETLTWIFNTIGGYHLTNLFVMLMALAVLWGFSQVLDRYAVPHKKILLLALLIHPVFWLESTSTIDFIVAMGFTWIGFALLLKNHWWAAGIAMALAIGTRATSVIAVGCILLFIYFTEPAMRKRTFFAALLAGGFGAMMYLPSADFSKWTLKFLKPAVGGEEYWTPYLRFGRFAYKNLTFWSLPVIGVLLVSVGLFLKNRKKILASSPRYFILFCVLVILTYEIFYIQIPTEPAYLLPTIPFLLMICGFVFNDRPGWLWIMVALIALANVLSFNIARPNDKNHATSVSYGFWADQGRLTEDIGKRIEYMNCGNQMCPEDILPAPETKKK
jgi:hypothetical protein